MPKEEKVYVGIMITAIILVSGFSIFLFLRKSAVVNNPEGNTSASKTIVTITPTPTRVPSNTIMITDRRALPKSLTIKKDSEVNFANLSGELINIESADDNKILNLGVIKDGETSDVITFKTVGKYTYTNKLNPRILGEIIVK